MKSSIKTNSHVVDLLFTLALFCVFTASSLMVVLIGAKVYKGSISGMTGNYDMRTSLTYISQKVRQGDVAGGVYIDKLNGSDALVLEQSYNETAYQTWIYYDEGYVKELFTRKDNPILPESGSSIVAVADFKIERDDNGIFTFTTTDKSGKAASVSSYSRCMSE